MAFRLADPVGRGTELERLEGVLDELEAGAATCVVEGEAGIGKTLLLGELRRRAEERGHLVLGGSAAEFERDLPFGVWVDALDAYVASQDFASAAGTDAAFLADLAGVLPSVARTGGTSPPGSSDQRHRAHRAIRTLLELIADRKPLVLVLDDLHWCDGASIEVLAALLRRRTDERVLLALGYRSGMAPAKLSSALAAPGVTVIELGPLSEADSAELTGERVDARRRAAIYAESGGNPFYMLQLAQAAELPSRSSTGDRLALGAGVPRTVAAALLEELEAVSADARLLLSAGAIAGDPFEPELAYAVAELTQEDGATALDELLEARLLRDTDVPRRFAFRHPLVRRAVYESTKGGWRLYAHARAAAMLETQGASPAARAHHVEQSGAKGDPAAIALLLRAGDDNAPTGPAGAARWYAAALRLIPHEDRPARLRAQLSLAEALRSTGGLERCAATLLEAIELVPAGDTVLRLRLTSACAACEHYLGHHRRAQQRLTAGLRSLPDQGSREAVVVRLDLAAGAFFTFDLERMCELGRRALAVAGGLDEPGLSGSAAAMLAHGCSLAGHVAEARSSADEAGARFDALADDGLREHLEGVNRLAWAEYFIERFDDSIRHAARGVAVARATGQGRFVPLMLSAQTLSMAARGELAEAEALQEEAIEAAEFAANDYVTSSVLTTAANLATRRGDLERARRAATQAVACTEGVESGLIAAMAGVRLAVTLRELGHSSAETESLLSAAGGWDMPRTPPAWRLVYNAALTRVELDAGDRDRAAARSAAAEAVAAELELPLGMAVAQRARAGVLLADDRAAEAADLALASGDGAEAAGAPVEAALSRVVAGRALAAAGERDRAVALLRPAERVLDARGALRDRGEARRVLRQLGARTEPRARTREQGDGLDSLSGREREIAALVTDRMTNKEVAAELFLSEKTVESHLRNIFAKLGASSRVEVARAVERSLS